MVFVYQERGRWGSVARSRDPGLHGRRPVFATPRALARSYVDPYVDYTGRVTGFALVDLNAVMGDYDWRTRDTNVWKVERTLLDYPHQPIRTSDARFKQLKKKYVEYRAAHNGRKPIDYRGREKWTEIPDEFTASQGSRSRRHEGTKIFLENPDLGDLRVFVIFVSSWLFFLQSRSKSRVGLVIGSLFAWRSASSNRLDSASPRFFSLFTDCWKIASRRSASSAMIRCASLSSGLFAALRLGVRDDPAEIQVDHQRRTAAGAGDFEFRFETCHH